MSKKIQPWKKLESKIYEHSPYRKIKDVLYEMPDGQQRWYPLKKEENVACIFALTVDNQVILARQYRPGPDQIIDELPGGVIEREEPPIKAARRELLLEETGYIPQKIVFLGKVLECAYSTKEREIFIATGCEKQSDQQLDPYE